MRDVSAPATGLLGLVVVACWPALTGAADVTAVAATNALSAKSLGSVHYLDGRLTVSVQDAATGDLVREIAEQSGLALVQHAPLDDPISIEFSRLPLAEGLRRILGDRSFVLEYAAQSVDRDPAAVPRPQRLWVLARAGSGYPPESKMRSPSAHEQTRPGTARDDPVTISALTSEDAWERKEAVEALGARRRSDDIVSLGLALRDEDEDVRGAAVDALARIGGDDSARELAVALQDESDSIRESAVDAMARIGGPDALQALRTALWDDEPWLRAEAVEALGKMGGDAAMKLAEQALEDEDELVRNTAAGVLGLETAEHR